MSSALRSFSRLAWFTSSAPTSSRSELSHVQITPYINTAAVTANEILTYGGSRCQGRRQIQDAPGNASLRLLPCPEHQVRAAGQRYCVPELPSLCATMYLSPSASKKRREGPESRGCCSTGSFRQPRCARPAPLSTPRQGHATPPRVTAVI